MNELVQYGGLLNEIKNRIRQAQVKAVISVNAEMIHMYFDIGKLIYNRQQLEGWGSGVISRLSKDIRNELSDIKGFSERNINFMVQMYKEYEMEISIVKQAVSQLDLRKQLICQIPWGIISCLCKKLRTYPCDFGIWDKPFKMVGAIQHARSSNFFAFSCAASIPFEREVSSRSPE